MSSGNLPGDLEHGTAFLGAILKNPNNSEILDRFSQLGLTDWWLTAGCLAQTIWNLRADRLPTAGIADYDVFYVDPDTSWDAEDQVISRTNQLFSDLPVKLEIRNQARVPIWYAAKYGFEFGAVRSASDGIDRFAYQTTAIGVRKVSVGRDVDAYRIYAPFGLEAVMKGQVIPNPVLPVRNVYEAKVARWKTIWPDLDVMPWPDDA